MVQGAPDLVNYPGVISSIVIRWRRLNRRRRRIADVDSLCLPPLAFQGPPHQRHGGVLCRLVDREPVQDPGSVLEGECEAVEGAGVDADHLTLELGGHAAQGGEGVGQLVAGRQAGAGAHAVGQRHRGHIREVGGAAGGGVEHGAVGGDQPVHAAGEHAAGGHAGHRLALGDADAQARGIVAGHADGRDPGQGGHPGADGDQVQAQVGLADADLAGLEDLGVGDGLGALDPDGGEAEQRRPDQVGHAHGEGDGGQGPAEDAPAAPHPGGQDGLAPLGDAPVGRGPPPGGRSPGAAPGLAGPLGHEVTASPGEPGWPGSGRSAGPKSPTSWTSVRRVMPSSSRARRIARRMRTSTSAALAPSAATMKLAWTSLTLAPRWPSPFMPSSSTTRPADISGGLANTLPQLGWFTGWLSRRQRRASSISARTAASDAGARANRAAVTTAPAGRADRRHPNPSSSGFIRTAVPASSPVRWNTSAHTSRSASSPPWAPAFIRTPPPTVPGIATANAIPPSEALADRAATLGSGVAAPASSSFPSTSTRRNRSPRWTTIPGQPPSATSMFDPRPTISSGTGAVPSTPARAARSSTPSARRKTAAGPPSRKVVSGARGRSRPTRPGQRAVSSAAAASRRVGSTGPTGGGIGGHPPSGGPSRRLPPGPPRPVIGSRPARGRARRPGW